MALVLWLLGYPDQALTRLHEALILAQEVFHPHNLTFALGCAPMLHQFRREGQAAQERAEAAITLASEQGFSFWVAWGTLLRGWALAEQGRGEEGVTQIRQGLAAYRATGSEHQRPYWLALLAEAYSKVGQVEEGLTALTEALATVDKTGERFYEAELCRLRGQLTLQKFQVSGPKFQVADPQAEAEEWFWKAIDIARRQQAKSLELRASLSLARLWQQRGKQHAACNTLSEIYGWFTEGFDTADLKEAKALLEQIA
jgi:predicted ATPase